MGLDERSRATGPRAELHGRRVLLRPIVPEDFPAWREVRLRNRDWLLKWEPTPARGRADDATDLAAFTGRCGAREREWQLGAGYGFGIFVPSRPPSVSAGPRLAGEINLSGVQRGPFQNAYVGYWIDEAEAGNGYVPESLVVAAAFAFEDLRLHRLQVAIIPRNRASRRVAEKLGLRDEGIARNYLSINGVWEDHVRYALTAEDWAEHGPRLQAEWMGR